MRRQAGNDLTTQVVSDITIIRDADRQLELFEHTVLPRALLKGWTWADPLKKQAMPRCSIFWTTNDH